MTADEAFVQFLHTRADHALPWELSAENMRPIFMAGWQAAGGHATMDVRPGAQQAKEPLKLTFVEPSPITPEQIYAAYPRKVGKQGAVKAIQRAATRHPMPALLQAVIAYATAVKAWPASEKQYVPHPQTWFNQGRYEDDPKEWQRGTATTSAFSRKH